MKVKYTFFANPLLQASLRTLYNAKLPIKTAYKLDKNFQKFTQALKHVGKEFETIRAPFVKPGTVDEIAAENLEAFQKANDAFGEREYELEMRPILLKELPDSLEISPAELSALKDYFLVEMESVPNAPLSPLHSGTPGDESA